MASFIRVVLPFVGLLSLMEQAAGAEVHVVQAGDGALVFVDGEIVEGDLRRVMKAVEQVSYQIILLRSPASSEFSGLDRTKHSSSKSTPSTI